MGIIIDIIVIAFILLCMLYGYKKGLVKVGIRLVSFVIAILISLVLYRPITTIVINYTPIQGMIEKTIIENVNKKYKGTDKSLNSVGNDNATSKINELGENILENAKTNLVEQTAKSLSYNIIHIGVIILIFLLTRIILMFITVLADIISKLPIIKQFNKLGGILYGVIIGFTIISVILWIINFVDKTKPDNNIKNTIDNTIVTKIIYNNNILNLFI